MASFADDPSPGFMDPMVGRIIPGIHPVVDDQRIDTVGKHRFDSPDEGTEPAIISCKKQRVFRDGFQMVPNTI